MTLPNTEVRPFTYYCLGCGMLMCNTCQYDANWKHLNDDRIISDIERKSLQKDMTRIDESFCQLHNGRTFLAKELPKQSGCSNNCAGCKCKED